MGTKFIITTALALSLITLSGCDDSVRKTASASIAASATLSLIQGKPTFESSTVNAYVQDYNKLVDEYTAALKAKDYSMIAQVLPKLSDINAKSAAISAELTKSELPRFQQWMDFMAQRLNGELSPAGQ